MFTGYEHLIGGFCGGIASTSICHPFDLLKIRYSANEGNLTRPQYSSYLHAVKSIIKVNGVRGLYQGLSASIIGSSLSWGLYFHFFQKFRTHITCFSYNPFVNNLIVGSVTGGFVISLTNPIWVCKTRLCLQYEHSTRLYKNLPECFAKIFREEGVKGFYHGFIPGLLGTVNGSIQFAVYNYLKDWRCKHLKMAKDSQLGTFDYLFFSMISKILSTVLTFPYQVLRTRLQDQHVHYKGMIDCTIKTLKFEGLKGLYKGMWIATLKQMPNSIVTYIVYEKVRHLLEKKKKYI